MSKKNINYQKLPTVMEELLLVTVVKIRNSRIVSQLNSKRPMWPLFSFTTSG